MHRPEDEVGTRQRDPEMYIAQRGVHKAAKHFRKPVIDAGKHAKHSGHTHHQVKVRHYEIGIVQLYIQRTVAQPYAGESAGNKQAYKSNTEQHSRRKPDIAPPQSGEPVKTLPPKEWQ